MTIRRTGLHRRDFIAGTAAIAASAALPAPSLAQSNYPSRPIRVIVPFAAGGPSDIIARVLAEALYQPLGQSVVIENRAGGGANIGIGMAARAEPDGYTLLATTSAIVINPSLYKTIPFDPIKSFAPISDLAISSQMLSVMPGYANSLAELIAKAKAEPGKLNYSSPGAGTQAQLTVELLKLRAGIDITHVPFSGGPPAVQALMTGTVQMVTNAVPTSEALARQGAIRALAVSGEKRWPSLPDVPTLVESGYPGIRDRHVRGPVRARRHPAGDRRQAGEDRSGGARQARGPRQRQGWRPGRPPEEVLVHRDVARRADTRCRSAPYRWRSSAQAASRHARDGRARTPPRYQQRAGGIRP